MAKAGRASISVNYSEVERNLMVTLSKVQRGTKKATLAAVQEIYEESQRQVPRDTETLANSGFYEVQGSYSNFVGVVGYGGKGDPVNPRTGQKASDYMVAVHEDLTAMHPTGKAKFLEDPVREYQASMLGKVAAVIRSEM